MKTVSGWQTEDAAATVADMTETETEDTRARIVELVEALIMERGFNAMSYQDVSDAIGIRKASVHYHFPTKADLGAAVIRRYVARLGAIATPVEDLAPPGFAVAFERLLAMFAEVARHKRICLGGMLGAEFETLPASMKAEVRLFYTTAQGWLGALLEAGRKARAFDFPGSATESATAIVALLEGALIITRVLDDPAQLDAALARARAIAGLVV